jgi:hypothetical protein
MSVFRVMTWKLYAVVSAGAFAATYLMSSPKTEPAPIAASTTAAPQSARQRAAETEIEALANSLHVQLKSDAVFRTPGRDPFRFQTKVQQAPAFVPPPAFVAAPSAPAPALPMLSLSGIATDVVDGMPNRSAVMSLPNGVVIVREGESVAGLYTVVAIGEDSIELESTTDTTRRTLRLGAR